MHCFNGRCPPPAGKVRAGAAGEEEASGWHWDRHLQGYTLSHALPHSQFYTLSFIHSLCRLLRKRHKSVFVKFCYITVMMCASFWCCPWIKTLDFTGKIGEWGWKLNAVQCVLIYLDIHVYDSPLFAFIESKMENSHNDNDNIPVYHHFLNSSVSASLPLGGRYLHFYFKFKKIQRYISCFGKANNVENILWRCSVVCFRNFRTTDLLYRNQTASNTG